MENTFQKSLQNDVIHPDGRRYGWRRGGRNVFDNYDIRENKLGKKISIITSSISSFLTSTIETLNNLDVDVLIC